MTVTTRNLNTVFSIFISRQFSGIPSPCKNWTEATKSDLVNAGNAILRFVGVNSKCSIYVHIDLIGRKITTDLPKCGFFPEDLENILKDVAPISEFVQSLNKWVK
jgi:hypothetical protein